MFRRRNRKDDRPLTDKARKNEMEAAEKLDFVERTVGGITFFEWLKPEDKDRE